MITSVQTTTWNRTEFDLEPTLRGDLDDTVVDVVPAGALAPTETLPPIDPAYLEDVSTEIAFLLLGDSDA